MENQMSLEKAVAEFTREAASLIAAGDQFGLKRLAIELTASVLQGLGTDREEREEFVRRAMDSELDAALAACRAVAF